MKKKTEAGGGNHADRNEITAVTEVCHAPSSRRRARATRCRRHPGRGGVRQDLLTVANETSVSKEAQVCLPAQFNPYLGGSSVPTPDDLQALCGGDGARAAQARINEKLAPLGRFLCQGDPRALST